MYFVIIFNSILADDVLNLNGQYILSVTEQNPQDPNMMISDGIIV